MKPIDSVQPKNLPDTIDLLRQFIAANGLPDFEAMLTQHYSQWLSKGSVIIDIGAHVGRHLKYFLPLAEDGGKAIAFEPIPSLYKSLLDQYSGQSAFEIHNVALSDRSGKLEFVINEFAMGESGLKERIYNNPKSAKTIKINCEVKTLDSFTTSLQKLDFIKMDIEGGEIDCLKGATETIAKFRPLIATEYGFGSYSVYNHNKFTLFEFAKGIDYVLYDLFLNSLELREDWDFACDNVYWDFFMVPKEKESDFLSKIKKKPPIPKMST